MRACTFTHIDAKINNTALPKLELSRIGEKQFLQCEKDLQCKKGEFLKNIEIIGCLTYKAIEEEF